jgi:transcriptional regulator with XRE-family HTH domain
VADTARTVPQRRLARVLRRLREDANLTIEQVAEKLDLSQSTVSRMETAQVGVRPNDLRPLLDIYGVDGVQRDELLQLARERRQQAWWNRYKDLQSVALASLERGTNSILQWSALLVPGLLQTEAYARAIIGDTLPERSPDIERRVEFRLKRQELLSDPRAPQFRVVLDEAILKRPIGGPSLMRRQLQHLVDEASKPNITLQVLPFGAGVHGGLDGEFTILQYPDPADPDVVYLETAAGQRYDESGDVARRYNLIFDRLQEAALKPEESVRALTDAIRDLRGDES